ncbi:hypothetical protein B0T22DRAFT_112115 [Podospora appendiculata]|uniref:Zn(2)-C6 fungal-type domain-containing protein n=1 Tax=Podospora appendiculata TaxID=314037 RepID=A0AAE0XLE9_9PEZI|nr:hypothetical protein B0T22DRAFT_112115 [Podospora appendiculata]
MADNRRGGRGYSRRENSEESHYPPPPGDDDDDHRTQYQLPPMPASSVAPLPPFQYGPPAQGYSPDPRYPGQRHSPPEQRYPPDPRLWSSESPTNANGYAPPPDARGYPLPSVQPGQERRPYDDRRPHDDRRHYPDPYYQAQARSGGYDDQYAFRYQQSGPYYGDFRGGAGAPQPQPPQQQAAPRQRTSIACRYCRKRKIRCSGYANTTNGKCTNCDKLRIDCVFQPVSSNSSTAFVPVSAVPGGVPPGTPLYGAYGQPLPPSGNQQQQQRPYQHPASDYPPPMHSPTNQYPPFDDRERDRDRDRDLARRRTRPSEEEHTLRLPPPNYPPDEDHRRRSPASNHSGTPPTVYHPYQQGSYDQNRVPTPHRTSPGGPSLQGQPQPQPSSGANPMSLDHLMGPDARDRGSNNDIDRNMLGRLNRRS